MITLSEFLLARIAEDEAVAEAAGGAEVRWGVEHFATLPPCYGAIAQMKGGEFDRVLVVPAERHGDHPGTEHPEAMQHMTRHYPARVLAECESKRRIVELHNRNSYDPPGEGGHECHGGGGSAGSYGMGDCPTIRLLATPYADHPDYRQEWKP